MVFLLELCTYIQITNTLITSIKHIRKKKEFKDHTNSMKKKNIQRFSTV